MVCSIHSHIRSEDQLQHQDLVQRRGQPHQQISYHSNPSIHMVCSIQRIPKVCNHSIHTKHQHRLRDQHLVLKLELHQQISCHSIPSIRMVCSIQHIPMVCNHSIHTKHQHQPRHQHLVQKLEHCPGRQPDPTGPMQSKSSFLRQFLQYWSIHPLSE